MNSPAQASGAQQGDVPRLGQPDSDPGRVREPTRASTGASQHDSIRVFIGLLVLLALTIALLNLVLYQRARSALAQQEWAELAHKADAKRSQMRTLFHHMESLARYIAEGPSLSTAATTMAGTLSPEDQQRLELELDRAVRGFRLEYLAILSPEGVWLAGTDVQQSSQRSGHSRLALDASEAPNRVRGDIRPESGGSGTFEVAVPMAAASLGGRVPVLLLAADADESLLPLLNNWSDFETGGQAYLVRAAGNSVQFLTSPEPRGGVPEETLAPMGASSARAGAMAAAGIESSVEYKDENGRATCAVTRVLPELGWGMVVQTERRLVMAPMHGVAMRLLALDVAVAACAGVIIWMWRRQYAKGVARTEVEVTRRHVARAQAILDTAFDAVLTFDREGRVCTVNRAGELLFGRAASEMDGQPMHRFLRWGGAGHSAHRELPPAGAVCGAECLRADGESFPAEFSLGRSGDEEELLYTAIIRDIRDRVEAERRIRESAEGLEATNRRLEEVNAQLEEASRLKSEFLANTSHELRTPLNGMIGFLQLVLDGMCENPEEETEFLKQALQCSRHLLGLINDVLDIARIESGKLRVEVERVDVENLFQDVHTVTHVQAAQKGISLRFEPPGEGVAARCDPAKTKQVLINLVGNSLKFTAKGSITVRSVARPELGHVMFEVVDTGIGIARERQAIIFEKFAQGDGSTTRKYGGTGLGLAISRSLVELMGGIIGVHSEGAGKGTKMFFSLPIWTDEIEEAPAVEEGVPERIEGRGGPLVLVVEDDPVFRRFMTALLNRQGYRTAQAESAESGWVLVRRLKPSTVVIDYALTCSEGARLRTGWDLGERLASDPETRHIPFVFVTGFDQQVRDRLQNNVFAQRPKHLVKPIDGATLVAAIEEVVGAIGSRQVRILMADDDPSVAAFVRKVLPEGRFHLDLASNGEECLHILRTQPRGFDLLLLDLMMPGVSGYDVLRQMALSGTSASLPVLVLTNYPEPRTDEERQLLEHGMVLDIVSKTAVHENPSLLAHVVEWHVEVAGDREGLEEAA